MGKNTKWNHFKTCESRLKDILMRVKHYGISHEEFLRIRRLELFETDSYHKIQDYRKDYLRGYQDAIIDSWYQNDLCWLHYTENEKGEKVFYQHYDAIPESIVKDQSFKSGRFWKKDFKEFSLANES